MRARPNSRPVLSDDEVAAQMRADGRDEAEVASALDVRRKAREAAQAAYDRNKTVSANDAFVRQQARG